VEEKRLRRDSGRQGGKRWRALMEAVTWRGRESEMEMKVRLGHENQRGRKGGA